MMNLLFSYDVKITIILQFYYNFYVIVLLQKTKNCMQYFCNTWIIIKLLFCYNIFEFCPMTNLL